MRPRTSSDIETARTLEEVADVLGISRQRAQQLEASALAKARKVLERHGLSARDFFDVFHRARHDRGAAVPRGGEPTL